MNLPTKRMNKKGVSTDFIIGIAFVMIGIVILFQLLAELVPIMQASGDLLQLTGAPLAELYGANGVVILIFMAVVLLAIIAVLFALVKGAGRRR